ncbi:MAG: metal-dependent transcriptional regulator [Anaerolineae bacterium]
MQSQAVEDYLKAIYNLLEEGEEEAVATTALAERLGFAPASITNMIKKLADLRLVEYKPYQGVALTEAGQKIALEVIRHHRLMELYLAEALGVPWDQVHDEAEKWEHVLSEDLEERIDAALGYPATDPHGAPIPTREGTIAPVSDVRLTDLKPGQSALVSQVNDDDPALLRYLGELGIYPEVEVILIAVAPFDGPLTVRVGEDEHTMGRKPADEVFVVNIREESG